MKKALTLICTHEYAAGARVVIDSFLRHNGPCDVVVFSDRDLGAPAVTKTVPITDTRFARKGASQFERIEMIRPQAHLELLGMGYDMVLYCDSDIYFTGPIAVPERSLFTPHQIDSIGRYDLRWIVESGFINIGLYWLKNDDATRDFLKSLAGMSAKVEDRYNTRPCGGYWQQSLYNYLPLIHRDYILSDDPAINVAYWNVNERGGVRWDGGKYLVGGTPMTCYHFSGWRGRDILTKFRPNETVQGDLRRLYHEYADELDRLGKQI